MTSKAELRAWARTERSRLSPAARAAAGEALAAAWRQIPGAERAEVWFVPISVRREIPTRPLIAALWAAGRRVAIPRVVGPSLLAVHLRGFEELQAEEFGIPSCSGPPLRPDLALLPGLAFDRFGGRLGTGGGFYDRTLADNPVPRFGLAFQVQLAEGPLPQEPHDLRVAGVLTERGFVRAEPLPGGPTVP